ncbi:MAG: hypothetical protein FK733_17790 [Asgard group archaeon]|nr:hypothetical protein [Asgard group archaeon]
MAMGFLQKKAFLIIFLVFIVFNPTTSSKSFELEKKFDGINFEIDFTKNNFDNPLEQNRKDETIGNQEIFWSLDEGIGQYVQKRATLLSVGEKCYVYFANETIDDIGQTAATATCNYYRDEFDALIYDKNVELMGHPNGTLGDVDGDPKVTILVAPLGFNGGVYLQKDELPGTYSNQREMFYIDTCYGINEIGLMVIMHEFNHLIWFNNDLNDSPFIHEGVAEFSVFYAGYFMDWNNRSGFANLFVNNHQRSLLTFHTIDNSPLPEDYGASFMFIVYLVEQYGFDFLDNLIREPLNGALGVDNALNETGFNESFNDVFLNWITTCTVDNEQIESGVYSFDNIDLTVNPDDEINNYPYQMDDVIHYPYGFHVKKLNQPPDEFTFSIANPYPIYSLGISIVVHDQNGWQVTQSNYYEENDKIWINVSGEEITEAYIITSIMNENTPTSYFDFIEVGSELVYYLSYSIQEGHDQTSSISIGLFGVIFGSIMILFHTQKRKKRRTF